MPVQHQKKIGAYLSSLSGQQRVFEEHGARFPTIDHRPVSQLRLDLEEIEQHFPGLLPPFEESEFFSHGHATERYYSVPAIRSYLAKAIGRLKAELDGPGTSPVTQLRQFPFVKNPELRSILERDYSEVQRAFISNCFRSTILLSGGCIEAVLIDLLLQHQEGARASRKAPPQSDLSRWDLANLLNVAVDLKLVSTGIEKLSHSVRGYRNLVHPGNEIRNELTFDAEEAKIAIPGLSFLARKATGVLRTSGNGTLIGLLGSGGEDRSR